MTLAPGQSLLHFRLIEKVGEGGMGEVWKAADTSLGREVAVKVLPAAFAADPERRARFEREAKLLGSLNHPNIATIHGLFEAQGVHFLAMELVRGDDLAVVLARGALPVREALDAAKQVALALESAHEAHVIHRDLKPANVKRAPDGTIKVLDFGLAKALESTGAAAPQSATVTSAGSVAGMILGTASYMSPEQARGLPVDRRTDIWAFGCLLFEMLTGTRAFDGPTVTDVLAAVVTGEPNWSKLPASTPAAVRRLLRRCLEKDAKKRLRDAGDAALLLEDTAEEAPAAAALAPRSAWVARFAALALVLALVGPALGWWLGRSGRPAVATQALVFNRITYSRGMVRAARFAADGQTVVYGAAWGGPPVKLYLGRTESAAATAIALPPAELLAISKKGELAIALDFAYYGWMGHGTLARTSMLGGAPREVVESVRVADWAPDSEQLAIVRRTTSEDHLEYPVGEVLDRTRIGYFGDVRVAPDGELVAYTDHPSWGDNQGALAIIDRNGHKRTLDSDLTWLQGIAWSRDGTEVWYTAQRGDRERALFAVDLEGNRRVVYADMHDMELFDIAADGRVLLGAQRGEREVLAKLEGFDEPRKVIFGGEAAVGRGIEKHGRAVLVSDHSIHEYETYVLRSDRPGVTRLTTGDGMGISPDGRSAMTASSDYRRMSVTPLGVGATREIANPDGIEYASSATWHPDGKSFVITGKKGSEASRAYVIDVESGGAKAFGSPGAAWFLFTGPPVSPDGKFVVMRDENGTTTQWPIEGGEPRSIPGLAADDQPLTYSEDGTALLVAGRSMPIVIERLDLTTGKRTQLLTVAPTDSAGLRYSAASITPSGKYWALSVAKLLSDLYVVEGLK